MWLCEMEASKKVFLDETFGPRVGQKRPLPTDSVDKKPLSRNGRKKLKKRLKKKALKEMEHEEDCNALVLPAKKRKVEKEAVEVAAVQPKKLSKKERKKLQRKVQLAEKRAKREDVLAELQKYQATPKQLAVLASIKEVHTQRPLKKLPAMEAKLVGKGLAGVKKWRLGKKKKKKKQQQSAPAAPTPESQSQPVDQKASEQNGVDIVESNTAEKPAAGKKKKKKKQSAPAAPTPESQSQPVDQKASEQNGVDIVESRTAEKPAAGKKKKKKKKQSAPAAPTSESQSQPVDWEEEEAVVEEVEEEMEWESKVDRDYDEQDGGETVQKARKKKASKQKAMKALKSKPADKPVEKPAAPAKTQTQTAAPTASSKSERGSSASSSEMPADGITPTTSSKSKGGSSASSSEKPADGTAVTASVAAAGSKSEQSQRTVVLVERKPKIQESRLKLPILGMEQEVMETINENPVVIVAGETGSGKTTQVPQFLYEAGYAHGEGIIAITQPRRVAAVRMSQRVAEELNVSTRVVSYQIRSEGNVTKDTKIKFMTDGVLLREVQRDFYLTTYSCIILDEAHERNVNTDILIGLLSRIVLLRAKRGNPLKLIIMSATLHVEEFTKNRHLFKVEPPVVQVEGRQFPVDLHWLKQTPRDHLKAAYRKVCQIHSDLPNGGILVFVTGRQEVHTLCHWLRKTFTAVPEEGATKPEKRRRRKKKIREAEEEEEEEKAAEIPAVDLDSYSIEPLREEAEEEEEERMEREEEQRVERELEEALRRNKVPISVLLGGDERDAGDDEFTPLEEVYQGLPLWVLPLYSLLPAEEQSKVFRPPPENFRLCVVATNIAETSLTIPNIRYVVDTGKVKSRLYDKVTGVSTFHVTWVSKASADQRLGRAGRVSAGKCYRLYSSAVFNDKFEKFSPPEILQRPIEDVVLLMKSWNISNIQTFPLPTSPKAEQIEAAERALTMLGALEPLKKQGEGSKLTNIGHKMAKFPVAPRYAKMLAISNQWGLLPYTIALVSALSVDQVFIEDFLAPNTEEENEAQKEKRLTLRQRKRELAGLDHQRLLGDMMVLLAAVLVVEREPGPQTLEKYFLRPKAIAEIKKIRQQLTNIANAMFPDAGVCIDPDLQPPTQEQAQMMRQVVLCGLGNNVARNWFNPPVAKNAPKWQVRHAYQCMDLAQPVYIHQTSVLHHQKIAYIVFQDIIESERGSMFMRGVAAVDKEWLPVYAARHCIMSMPMDDPPPDYDAPRDRIVCHMSGTFGRGGWMLPAMQLPYPEHRDKLRWFAVFLLEGKVEPALAKFSQALLSMPHTMVRPWAHLQPRTTRLLHAITQRVVYTRQRLREVWEKEPEYLLDEYLEWLPRALHGEVMAMWPPCKQRSTQPAVHTARQAAVHTARQAVHTGKQAAVHTARQQSTQAAVHTGLQS